MRTNTLLCGFILMGIALSTSCDRIPEPLRSAAGRIGTIAANAPAPEPPPPVRLYTYEVVNTFLHDPRAYTQGLLYLDGILYEGTGLYGASSIRKVDLQTGSILQKRDIPEQFFGEGIVVFENRVFQLTWTSGVAFVYDLETFDFQTQFRYPTQGWGLTHDGKRLIMSDGTANLYFRDPVTFEEIGRVTVTDEGRAISNLNELEYIDGEVYANIYLTDRIARIDPETGTVNSWIDLTGLFRPEDRIDPNAVLNGIAYDPQGKRLFVTGKWWPELFQIKLLPKE